MASDGRWSVGHWSGSRCSRIVNRDHGSVSKYRPINFVYFRALYTIGLQWFHGFDLPPIIPHFYADDTQLLMSSSPGGVAVVCRALEQCIHDVQAWCSSRRLQLNPTKTELIWFGSDLNLHRIATADVSVRVGDTVIQPCDRVRDLGVILDSSLSMSRRPVSFIFDGFERLDTYWTKTADVV